MSDTPKPTNKIALSSGVATALGMLILAFAIRDVVFQATVLVASAIVLFYCSIRLAFCFGQKTGYTIVTTISVVMAFTLIAFWQMNSKINQLEAELDDYVSATIQRSYWPYPHIYQLSVDDYVDDNEFIELIQRPELKELTHLYFKSDKLTDICLQHLSHLEKLEYVQIDPGIFSNEAETEFRIKNRDVTLIAPVPIQLIN